MRGDRIVTALIQTVEFRNFRRAAIRSTDGRFTVSATRARVAYVSYVPGGADRMAQTDWWRHGKRPKKPPAAENRGWPEPDRGKAGFRPVRPPLYAPAAQAGRLNPTVRLDRHADLPRRGQGLPSPRRS